MGNKLNLPVIPDSPAHRRGISRREMVGRLLGGAGAGLAVPAVAATHPIHKHLASPSTLAAAETKAADAAWSPQFLDEHQNDTLIVLAERIVPGSTQAQVNRFVDLLLSVDEQEAQKRFLLALSTFDAESLKRFSKPFKDVTEAQQNQLLTDASTMAAGEPHGGFGRPRSVPEKPVAEPHLTLRDHFENLKGWIAGAYYSSEVGMKELGWTGDVYFDSFPGCQHPEGHH